MVLNALEVFAPTEEAAEEARRGWTARTETLNIMYNNIPGLQSAKLETKNYIYDALIGKVYALTR